MFPKDIDQEALVSAVENFSLKHDLHQFDRTQKIYRELIPLSKPNSSQQYCFEVDLDKCSGCKACVTACYNENGLEGKKPWRSVGVIQNHSADKNISQHITTACHHCADPACLNGCPTQAYVKDQETGIVRHLDDQCFGCQYCILKCPYDVPKYSREKGIVHKCDMCFSRLKNNQAPACVRACPTGAIRIKLVEKETIKSDHAKRMLIPDTVASNYTYPSTEFLTKSMELSRFHAIDQGSVSVQEAHLPLVIMLVLTQLSVGSFVVAMIDRWSNLIQAPYFFNLVVCSLVVALLAIVFSVFHLGRPQYAFRAFLGFKTSWLSREIILFGGYVSTLMIFSSVIFMQKKVMFVSDFLINGLSIAAIIFGIAGVISSIMVYRDTKRIFWDRDITTFKFLLTTMIMGLSFKELLSLFVVGKIIKFELLGLILLVVSKTMIELEVFQHLKISTQLYLQKTAKLMWEPLKKITLLRFVFVFLAVMAMVIQLLTDFNHIFLTTFIFLSLLAGELLERYLFFTAVVPFKMPGGKLN